MKHESKRCSWDYHKCFLYLNSVSMICYHCFLQQILVAFTFQWQSYQIISVISKNLAKTCFKSSPVCFDAIITDLESRIIYTKKIKTHEGDTLSTLTIVFLCQSLKKKNLSWQWNIKPNIENKININVYNKGAQLSVKRIALENVRLPIRVWLLTMCKVELAAVIARLKSMCLWCGWKW